MGRIRSAIAATVVGAALAAPGAAAQTSTDPAPTTTTTDPPEPPSQPQPVVTLPPPPSQVPKHPPKPKPKPAPKPKPPKTGGTKPKGGENEKGTAKVGGTAPPPPAPLTPTACGPVAIPAYLGPIYQAAAQAYDLGPAGPSILAAINEIESGFGQNLGPSSAGRGGLDAVHAVDLGRVRRRRRSRRHQGPEQPQRCDLRRRPVPARGRHAGGPRGRRLRLQPCRLVRRRGDGEGRLLQRDRQRGAGCPVPDPEAAGAGVLAGRRVARVGPGRLYEGLPGGRRALRPRAGRRLGAGRRRSDRVQLR